MKTACVIQVETKTDRNSGWEYDPTHKNVSPYYMKLYPSHDVEIIQIALCIGSKYICMEDLEIIFLQHLTWNPNKLQHPLIFFM
jgi:hypothetical protein